MRVLLPIKVGLAVVLLGGLFGGASKATTIYYQAVSLNASQQLWQYDYYVTGDTFGVNQDFTIDFNYQTYSKLQNGEPATSTDWNVLLLQPDLNLPAPGEFDALSLVNNPSNAVVFQVDFVWSGAGALGSQPFTLDQLDANGNVLQILATGNTVPYVPPTGTPEPATWLGCLAGLGFLCLRKAKRPWVVGVKRSAPFVVLGLMALAPARLSAQQQFQLVGINQVSSTRVTRTQWDYVYTATVQNTGAAATGVTATVTSSAASTVIVNGSLSFGSIGAGQTATSSNTFTIEQDRTVPFVLSVLSFQFQTSTANQPPVANAGPNQVAQIGQTVTLDGSGSTDADGTIVTYAWTFVGSVPAGASLSITNAGSVKPTVYIPSGGTFTFQLIVTDNHGLSSAAATTKVFTGPVAVPGANQTVGVGQSVQLNGSGSFDPSGFPLTYLWTLTLPNGSKAALSNAAIVNPTFVADVAGVYTATLVVNNGVMSSEPESVLITAMTGQLFCGDIVSGNIQQAAQVDQYTYSGTAGGIITVTLGLTGGFDSFFGVVPKVTLYDPTGAVVTSFQANTQRQITTALSGLYLFQVESNDLVSTGTYNLGVVCRNPLNPSSGLSCGGIVNGKVSQTAQVDQYTYNASAGGVITVTLTDTGGFDSFFGVVPEAVLFDPTGAVVTSFQANSQQQITLKMTGNYLFQVFSNDLVSTGTYNLGVVCRNPLNPSSGLSCGGIVNGKVSQSSQVDQYTYNASAGGVITVTLTDTGGFDSFFGVVPEAVLFDPTGAVVTSFQANSQQQITLKMTGNYLFQVYSNDLVSTGTYNLGVVCRNPLNPSSGLSCGGIVNGKVSQSSQVDQYTYSASAGKVITVTLADTGGFDSFFGVVPETVIFDPTGAAVTSLLANSQQQFTPALTGTYLFQVFSNDLVTGGTYNLGIVCP